MLIPWRVIPFAKEIRTSVALRLLLVQHPDALLVAEPPGKWVVARFLVVDGEVRSWKWD